jgi:phospholipase/carboxylesterase
MKKLLVLLLLTGAIYWWRLPPTVKAPSSDQEFEYIVRITGEGSGSAALPMIIALHGNGDTPAYFFDTLLKDFSYPARIIAVKGPMSHPGGRHGGSAWPIDINGLRECGDALADAISVLAGRFPTQGQPVILGFSGGAYVAYYLAAHHSDYFSHILPLSGGLPGRLMSAEEGGADYGAAVTAFHGTRDQVINFSQGKAAVENLRRRGVRAELISFDGGHLGVFTSANGILLNQLSNVLEEIRL